jgi:mannitol-1-phosphate 5-dehydrogenase
MKIVVFGAGKIGRSFIGALFARAGWDVVFIDIVQQIVEQLKEARYYTVVINREGQPDEERRIGPVRAVWAAEREDVAAELVDADLAAVSVGQSAISTILPLLSAGIKARHAVAPLRPLNIIFAENIRGIARIARESFEEDGVLPEPDTYVGLVETSIGKMVPLMRDGDLAGDPLRLFAEEYETLIVDGGAFKGGIPAFKDGVCEVPGLKAVSNIHAWVDRKLFVHNLGHAACAYLGFRADPAARLLAQTLAMPGVEAAARESMREAAGALLARYSASYTQADLYSHIDDLIVRFKNTALGDTVYRVGRDLYRKLSRDDRIVGAMLLCADENLPFDNIAKVYLAALDFRAVDDSAGYDDGVLFPPDAKFHSIYGPMSKRERLAAVTREVSALSPTCAADKAVLDVLMSKY